MHAVSPPRQQQQPAPAALGATDGGTLAGAEQGGDRASPADYA